MAEKRTNVTKAGAARDRAVAQANVQARAAILASLAKVRQPTAA